MIILIRNKKFTGMVMLDLTKAFDTVCHKPVVPNLFTPGTGKNLKKCSRTGNKKSVVSRTYICNLSVNQSCRCVTYCKILA